MSRPLGTARTTARTAPTARTARRVSTVGALLVAAVCAGAVPAFAHTEVEAEGARALAENVTLDFHAASESDTAGISKLEVILPKGLAPADIAYEEGPKGWTYDTTSRGWTVSGPELAVGANAEFSVKVRQLPDAKELVFKTLQSYSDGRVDRWIELDDSGDDSGGHGHPAPALKLGAAEPGATPIAPSPSGEATSAAPSSEPPAAADSPSPVAAGNEKDGGDGGLSPAAWTGIGAAALLVLGGAGWWLKRRDTSPST
ncbi:DUF1775 domain-containing protein [Streptomyces sp. NPDC091377]|uniref:DUF1775 domain-containing protein n=1 Tax=Streptomyces sp. NPDC091377 TaxID=3365995 RepID=UPI0037F49318